MLPSVRYCLSNIRTIVSTTMEIWKQGTKGATWKK